MADIYEKLAQDDGLLETDKNVGFVFAADELRSITLWPDQVVEDYLSKTASIALQGGVEQDIIDAVLALQIRVTALEAKVAALDDRVTALEAQVDWLTPASVVTATGHATTGNEFVYCQNPRPEEIIVFLNATPRDGERAWITRGGYKVQINGNGNQINGEEFISMKRQNETRALEFNAVLSQWVIV